MRLFNAGVLHAPGVISYEEVPAQKLGEGEVRIKVEYSGICSSDLGRVMNPGGAYNYPLIPGHEFSGTVFETNGSSKFKEGDKVAVCPLIRCEKCEYCAKGQDSLCNAYTYLGSRCEGGFAEYVTVPEKNLLPLPQKVSLKDASLAEPISVALHGVKRAGLNKEDTVLIYGMGTIGLFALQWAKHLNAEKIIAVDRNPHKLSLAKELGAHTTINARDEDTLKRVHEETSDNGCTVVLECAGAVSTQTESIEAVKKSGKIVLLGNSKGDLVIPEKLVPGLLRKEIIILGSWNYYFAQEWPETLSAIDSGHIQAERLITHEFQLSEITNVFRDYSSQKLEKPIKVCFRPIE